MTRENHDRTDPQGTEKTDASGPNPYAAIPPSETPVPAGARRPMSLRAALDEQAAQTPGQPVSPPSSSGGAQTPGGGLAGETPADGTASSSSPFDPVFERLATAQDRATAFAGERPEVVVGTAFVGGLILAAILKRLGRR